MKNAILHERLSISNNKSEKLYIELLHHMLTFHYLVLSDDLDLRCHCVSATASLKSFSAPRKICLASFFVKLFHNDIIFCLLTIKFTYNIEIILLYLSFFF